MSEWISVKKKLPPKLTAVLIWEPSYPSTMFIGYYCGKNEWSYLGNYFELDKKSYWQKLPKPPETNSHD